MEMEGSSWPLCLAFWATFGAAAELSTREVEPGLKIGFELEKARTRLEDRAKLSKPFFNILGQFQFHDWLDRAVVGAFL